MDCIGEAEGRDWGVLGAAGSEASGVTGTTVKREIVCPLLTGQQQCRRWPRESLGSRLQCKRGMTFGFFQTHPIF